MTHLTSRSHPVLGQARESDVWQPRELDLDAYAAVPYRAAQLIGDLERGDAITSQQATRLLEGWHELENEWWSSPYLRTVCEHSRAYIDQLRHQKADRPGAAS